MLSSSKTLSESSSGVAMFTSGVSSGARRLRESEGELSRLRNLDAEVVLLALCEHAKADPDFTPLKNKATKRFHVVAGGTSNSSAPGRNGLMPACAAVAAAPLTSPCICMRSTFAARCRNSGGGCEVIQATSVALVAPLERRRRLVPSFDGRFQCLDDVRLRLWILSGQRPPADNALNRLGHVQPRSAQRCVQGHHAMRKQPRHERRRPMALQIIPDQ
jgi:hypothetical protein